MDQIVIVVFTSARSSQAFHFMLSSQRHGRFSRFSASTMYL
jgi:hypothetical protein